MPSCQCCMTNDDLHALSHSPHVCVLKLDTSPVNHLSWLAALTPLTSLTMLSLAHCTGIHDFSGPGALPHLRELSLDGTAVSDLDWMAALPLLEGLDLSYAEMLTDAPAPHPAPGLRRLKLLCPNISSLA